MDTNKMLIKNKRGDKILSLYWFAILIIIAGGIFAMVYVYYGFPYDVRDIENRLLINAVADCVSYTGRINQEIISSGEFYQNASLDKCNLIFTSPEWEEEQYYVKVDFYRINDLNNSLRTLTKGNLNWAPQCEIQKEKESKNLVQCSTKAFYSLDDKDNQYIIKILGIVRKSEKNVRT
jgi:hypothetical protein